MLVSPFQFTWYEFLSPCKLMFSMLTWQGKLEMGCKCSCSGQVQPPATQSWQNEEENSAGCTQTPLQLTPVEGKTTPTTDKVYRVAVIGAWSSPVCCSLARSCSGSTAWRGGKLSARILPAVKHCRETPEHSLHSCSLSWVVSPRGEEGQLIFLSEQLHSSWHTLLELNNSDKYSE